jgi:hypothetical protein
METKKLKREAKRKPSSKISKLRWQRHCRKKVEVKKRCRGLRKLGNQHRALSRLQQNIQHHSHQFFFLKSQQDKLTLKKVSRK